MNTSWIVIYIWSVATSCAIKKNPDRFAYSRRRRRNFALWTGNEIPTDAKKLVVLTACEISNSLLAHQRRYCTVTACFNVIILQNACSFLFVADVGCRRSAVLFRWASFFVCDVTACVDFNLWLLIWGRRPFCPYSVRAGGGEQISVRSCLLVFKLHCCCCRLLLSAWEENAEFVAV